MNAANPSLEPDLSGQVLDRYRLIRLLGIGGMGAVYEAEHTALEKRVAVKLLRQQFTMQPIARKRFLREAKAATRVKHPNVVDISDFGETPEGRVYFVMELLAGRDLRAVIDEEPRLPWPRVQKILIQTASALEAAHSCGIVHRDLKPSNCFLVEAPGLEGQDFVKVLDFGIAKFSGGGVGEETQGLTSTDEIFGTVGYMAPEMAIGTTNDPRSDIYALGVMMYRMLVGALPFTGNTAFQILAKHVNEPPPRPSQQVPSIPAGVEAIVLKAMAKDLGARFESMRAFREALRQGGLGAPAQSSVAPPRTSPSPEARELLTQPEGAPKIEATLHLKSSVEAGAKGRSPARRQPPPSKGVVRPSPSGRVRPPLPNKALPRRAAPRPPPSRRTSGTPDAQIEGATVISRPIDVGSSSAPGAVSRGPAPRVPAPAPPRVNKHVVTAGPSPATEASGPTPPVPVTREASGTSLDDSGTVVSKAPPSARKTENSPVAAALPAPGPVSASPGQAVAVVPVNDEATVISSPHDVAALRASMQQPSVPGANAYPAPPTNDTGPRSAGVSAASVGAGFEQSASLGAPMGLVGDDPSSLLIDDEIPTKRRPVLALSLVGVSVFAAMVWLGLSLGGSDDDASQQPSAVAKAEVQPESVEPESESAEREPESAEREPDSAEPESELAEPEPQPVEPEPDAVEPPAAEPVLGSDRGVADDDTEPDDVIIVDDSMDPPVPSGSGAKKSRSSSGTPTPKKRAKKPLTDKDVVARLKRTLRSKCKNDGNTAVRVEGGISTSGKVLSPIVKGDPSGCVKKVVKKAKFPSGGGMRGMPIIELKL